MGFWSACLLGNDSALDIESALMDICGMKDAWFAALDKNVVFDYAAWRPAIEQHLDDMVHWCEHRSRKSDWLTWPTLGVFLMRSGAVIPETIRQRIQSVARQDQWAAENAERKYFVDAFIHQLATYPAGGGSPVEVEYEGLFDKFAEQQAKGESGLLNIRPPTQ